MKFAEQYEGSCAVRGGVLWVLFLIGSDTSVFMGVGFSEDHRTNTIFKTHFEKRMDWTTFVPSKIIYEVLHTQ